MVSAMHCQLYPQVRPLVLTVKAPKLAYRRGKREGEENPVSKHQIRSGNGRWARRREVGQLNPRCETKVQDKNGDRERGIRYKVAKRRKFLGAQTETARQSSVAPPATKRNEKSSTYA